MLTVQHLDKWFGGIHAVNDVCLTFVSGKITGLIGPNGAGKTTFVSMLCGRIPVSSGRIMFQGQDFTQLPAHKRIQQGMAYTFQITSIFAELSVYENVALAVQPRLSNAINKLAQEVEAALTRVGLQAYSERIAGDMAYGHQRLLEVAMGLGQSPQLLILDEPTQGLSDAEVDDFITLIKEVAETTTVLLIEHNINVVMALADRITVMNFGEIIAEGSPEEIRQNDAVQTAYLGG